MSQNIYEDPLFFANYAQLPRSQHGLDGAPEWPALAAMLPPLAGKRVVDLGCGYGWFSRYAAVQGASQVLGVDLSTRMLARAREMTTDPRIRWQQADFSSLSLGSGEFDVAFSSLALHYIADVAPLFAMLYQALTPGGSLVFSTEHPIFTCSARQGWLTDTSGQRYWGVSDYQREGERTSDWLAPGVIKYHRTLGTTIDALLAAGFQLTRLNEWGPDAEQLRRTPELAEEAQRPMLALFAATRPQ